MPEELTAASESANEGTTSSRKKARECREQDSASREQDSATHANSTTPTGATCVNGLKMATTNTGWPLDGAAQSVVNMKKQMKKIENILITVIIKIRIITQNLQQLLIAQINNQKAKYSQTRILEQQNTFVSIKDSETLILNYQPVKAGEGIEWNSQTAALSDQSVLDISDGHFYRANLDLSTSLRT